jgi:hypothetical protein
MFAAFFAAFSTFIIAVGVAAVIGHAVLIDLLLRPSPLKVARAPTPQITQTVR